MRGIKASTVSNTGCPYPGGSMCEVDHIERVGKLVCFGDNVIRYVVQSAYGVFFVRLSDQTPLDHKWLQERGKTIKITHVSREVGWMIFWAKDEIGNCSTCYNNGTYYYNVTGKRICTTCGAKYAETRTSK